MNTVLLATTPAQPWRNGGGSARELLAWPAGADWQVRVSVAEIARDGDFSAYPGVDRWFSVLEGAGVRLALPGGERITRCGDDPLFFAGEAAPACRLIDGLTQDLNLMLRRGAGAGTGTAAGTGMGGGMRRATPGATLSATATATRWRGLYAADATALIVAGRAHAAPAGSLLWSDDPRDAWQLGPASARAWWLLLEPA